MTFYITQETKKEVEDMLKELKNYTYATQNIYLEGVNLGKETILERILDNHIIIPQPNKSQDDYIMD